MDRDDLALVEAADKQGVSLTKTGDDSWSVGMAPNLEPLTPGTARLAETFLADGRIRLPDGREFKRVMTTKEARIAFGLDAADE
jgi:hypothetical protein